MPAPTKNQLRVFAAVAACTAPDDPTDAWGEVYSHFESKRGTPPEFEMRNFDRSSDACERRGWLSVARDGSGHVLISLTDAGRAVLAAGARP